MHNEKAQAHDHTAATLIRGAQHSEKAEAHGRYELRCFDKDGNLKWEEVIENLVTTVGKNYALDTFLAGSSFTVVGPYMGLISSVSYTAIAAADTMTSHTGWTEAGITNAPTYSGGRKTAVWNAASGGSKALSATLNFVFTGAGTVKGAFLVLGTGALATVDNTAGTLYSAGLLSGGDRVIASGDTLQMSYTASL